MNDKNPFLLIILRAKTFPLKYPKKCQQNTFSVSKRALCQPLKFVNQVPVT